MPKANHLRLNLFGRAGHRAADDAAVTRQSVTVRGPHLTGQYGRTNQPLCWFFAFAEIRNNFGA